MVLSVLSVPPGRGLCQGGLDHVLLLIEDQNSAWYGRADAAAPSAGKGAQLRPWFQHPLRPESFLSADVECDDCAEGSWTPPMRLGVSDGAGVPACSAIHRTPRPGAVWRWPMQGESAAPAPASLKPTFQRNEDRNPISW